MRPYDFRVKGLVWRLGLLVLGVTSCIRFYSPTEKNASEPAAEAAEAEPEAPRFDAEEAKLAKARAALDQQAWQEAKRLAADVRRMLRDRELEDPSDEWMQVFYAATAMDGLAQRGAVDELAALFVFDQEGLDPERCPADYRDLCDELETIVQKDDYKALFQRVKQGPVSGMAERVDTGRVASNYYYRSIPGMAGYSEASIGYFLKEHVVSRLRKKRRKYGAVWVSNHFEATLTQRNQGPRVSYRWKGEAHNITATSCRGDIVGKVKIGASTYDVERCRRGTSHHRGGNLTMTLSKEDAATVDFKAGDAALVVFETRKVRGSGLNLNLGTVRLVRTKRKKK